MHIHFIAIGGAAMHNLAIALKKKGYHVTGSDDEIYEPSKSRLLHQGILPESFGWFPEKLSSSIDAVILGMHARVDNPELLKAQEMGLKIYSYPEFLYEQTKNKKRVVIGGSHGKTTVTSMIMHVLKHNNRKFDFMVGAQLEGFDCMVELTEENEIAIFEGDEYLASPVDRRPKFHLYQPHIALITGIAWDHINVFPTFEGYLQQFEIFANTIVRNGVLIYSANDEHLPKIFGNKTADYSEVSYTAHAHEINNGQTWLTANGKKYAVEVFGEHNMQNINAAKMACIALGLGEDEFYNAITSFKGAAKRLEPIHRSESFNFFRDFAHSPSKLKATTMAVKNQFTQRPLVACMELHTFSSLNENFLHEYEGSMNHADEAIVYYNPRTIEHKKLKPISPEQVKSSFNRSDLVIFTEAGELAKYLKNKNWNNKTLLMMSSGNFDGMDFSRFSQELTGN